MFPGIFPGSGARLAADPVVPGQPTLFSSDARSFVVRSSLVCAVVAVICVASAIFGFVSCIRGSLGSSNLFLALPAGYLAYNFAYFLRNLVDVADTSSIQSLRSTSVDSLRANLGRKTFFFEPFVAFVVDLVRQEIQQRT